MKCFPLQVNPVGAILVSQHGEVLANGHTSCDHPLKHAIMCCIDHISQRQGGGIWQHNNMPSLLQQKLLSSKLPSNDVSSKYQILFTTYSI